jgi:hypothetical protein
MTQHEHQCLVAGCTGLACFGYGNPAEMDKMRWACGEHHGLLEANGELRIANGGNEGPSTRHSPLASRDLFWRSD